MNMIALPTRSGYYVMWDTGKRMKSGRAITKSYESRDKAKVEAKTEEVKKQGLKVVASGECFF